MEEGRLSMSVRLRRVRTETAHVSVPISDDLLVPDESNPSSRRIDVDKLIAAALDMGKADSIAWSQDAEEVIQLHPVQTPPTMN